MLIAVWQCGEGWGGVSFALVWWLQSRVASDTFGAPWLLDEDDSSKPWQDALHTEALKKMTEAATPKKPLWRQSEDPSVLFFTEF